MKIIFASTLLAAFSVTMPALAADPTDCSTLSPMTAVRQCMGKNIEKLNASIDKKVFDVCSKQVAATGSMGPAAVDDRLACRVEKLSKILKDIN